MGKRGSFLSSDEAKDDALEGPGADGSSSRSRSDVGVDGVEDVCSASSPLTTYTPAGGFGTAAAHALAGHADPAGHALAARPAQLAQVYYLAMLVG